jgi:hypothetical protein
MGACLGGTGETYFQSLWAFPKISLKQSDSSMISIFLFPLLNSI